MKVENALDGKARARNARTWSYAVLFALGFSAGMASVAAADGSCIVSGDITRSAASTVASAMAGSDWFDSSSFVERITNTLGDFNSFPYGIQVIFR